MTKTRQWIVFTAVAVVLVLVAGWFLLAKPQRSHAADLRDQAATVQQNNQVLLSQVAALEAEQKNLPAQQARLQKFATQVPDNPAEPTLIRQLTDAAKGAGVDLISLTPGTATPVGASATASATTSTAAPSLVQLPVAIGITGTFPNVESFFQSLESLPRALMVTGWSLCEATAGTQSQGSGSGSASCQLPQQPNGDQLPKDAIGGTLNASVYYAPAAAPATTAAGTTTTTTTAPATTSSTAATPAPSTTAAPAN